MCGFVGVLSPSISQTDLESSVRAMSATIARRGPDDSGFWCDKSEGFAIAHRRLSILDLSNAGHQPMLSASGRYVLAFNGEIYNHKSLRCKLENSASLQRDWVGNSDTETLLACVEAWGLEATMEKSVGMFSIALWDRKQCELKLARDRFGEKPLYWAISGCGMKKSIIFASEIHALHEWPYFEKSIDRQSLAQFMRFGAVSAPKSIYCGVEQLLPGNYISIRADSLLGQTNPKTRAWWCLRDAISTNVENKYSSEVEALGCLHESLREAVELQRMSDVPLGSFLSGGIDSSLVTALLQSLSSKPVRTFTIGFEEDSFNEAPHARAVAEHLGTEHTEVIITSADALALIPQLPHIYTEPFADSSQLPTHLVCREARRTGLTVALSGDGGDEFFGGYNRYFWSPRIWKICRSMPWELRRHLAKAIKLLPPNCWDALGRTMPYAQLGHKAFKIADRLEYVRTVDNLYQSLVSQWLDPIELIQPTQGEESLYEYGSPLDWNLPDVISKDSVARMMAFDALNYLPNDILTKIDRASMATSLETRAPFLDHRVAELSWRLPMKMKIRGNTGKWALRQILYRYVPQTLVDRPKTGFGIPVGEWLRGPLRPWAESMLDFTAIKSQGFLQPEPIKRLWEQHLSGRFDHTSRVWTILMWQAWLMEWG